MTTTLIIVAALVVVWLLAVLFAWVLARIADDD